MILVDPNIKYIKSFKTYVNQYKERNDRFYLGIYEEAFDSFSKYVTLLEDNAQGKNLPYGWSAYRTFWLEDKGEILAVIRIRDKDVEYYGHIGYDVAPLYRKKGYGTKILELGLEKAKKMGLKKIILTCLDKNWASQKIIEKNGGEMIKTIENDDGKIYYAYEVRL